jgi:hypothetical protein
MSAATKTAQTAILTCPSPRNCKPLRLVPPLQRARPGILGLLVLPVRPRRKHPLLHRNRLVLWPLRLARSLCALCLPVGWRERPT